jgi:hypothetical protein
MKKLLDILSEVVTSIPVHNIHKSAQFVYQVLRKAYPNTPEYILKDFLSDRDYSRISKENILKAVSMVPGFITRNYKLKILNVNPMDFTDETIDWMVEREFGDSIEYNIPKDKERTEFQRKIARADGRNEPIVVIKTKDGKYELIEGWHRTMSILKLGDNGEDLKNWDKVKIRAFVSEE